MATDPVSAGLGAAGLLLNNQSNNSANNRADHAQRQQDAILQRQTGLFDRLLSIVDDADRSGQFDPTRRIEQFTKDMNEQAGRDQSHLAGAMRISGYRPGDTELSVRSEAIRKGNAETIAKGTEAIRQGAFRDRLTAFSAVNPMGLNPALSVYGQREHDERSRVTSPGGFVASLSPYLIGQPQQQQRPGFRLVTDSPFDGGNGAGKPYWMRGYNR